MRIAKWWSAVALSVFMAACGGGGGGAGTPPFGDGDGDGDDGSSTASNLVLALDKTSITNAGTDTVIATATATDSNGRTLSGIAVSFEVNSDATYTPSAEVTDAQGNVTAAVSAGSNRSNRVITVTARTGGLARTASFSVTGAKLTGTPLPAIVAPSSTGNHIDYRLVDVNDNPMIGMPIQVSGAGIETVNGTTGSRGEFRFTYTAPSTPDTLEITATAGGVPDVQFIQVQSSSSSIPPVNQVIQSASVSANPSVVATNTDTTNNRTEIRALFLGSDNAPLRNVRVRFDLNGDPNSIGGAVTTADNVVYSNESGIATAAYRPGSRSSPTDGVTIRACYSGSDFAVGTCPNSATTTLTVASEPLSVTIGTNELVETGDEDLTYIARFVVMVVDSSGRAMADVEITPSVDLDLFFKGQYVSLADWTRNEEDACVTEDTNRNGVLEAGEDRDGDGILEPRKSDVAVSMIGGSKTNSSGIAVVKIEYPKNLGSWVRANILVSAAGVAGTEGRATWTEILRIPRSAITADASPAFVRSPYGIEAGCTNPN